MTPEYRAWDKDRKKYSESLGFISTSGEYYDGLLEMDDDPQNCQFVIEQYTGLKDVKGNKIFEGDIVHCENDYQGTDYTGKVMFFNGGFCVWTGGFRNYVWDDMIPEIIGNIHENLDLLEEGQ